MNEQWRTLRPGPRRPWRGSPWGRGGSPRYGGGGRGGRGHNSPGFQRFWPPSPYQEIPPPFATSTPFQRPPRPPHFGNRGKPRFESPWRNQEELGISAWVSPAMWEDPWKEFYEDEYGSMDLNETRFAEDSKAGAGDISSPSELEQSDSNAFLEGESQLGVSDMILKSFVEPDPDTSGCKPLPNVTMEDLKDASSPSKEKTDDECIASVESNVGSKATSHDDEASSRT